ncbi:type II secretion system protein GspL [Salinicola sp. JS01]|uniref:type II secretion system protein GspL n=1 Tax=Salinicola sp. JS01 TaxID=3050071 RepID=UPI00255B6B01|nr:type II secretion system protein GspL [Salinicola sp. JS01]WIX31975.1 type II secretion system protein GspL [Salinicola sp. JS01]
MRRSARPARAATRLLVAPRQRLAPLIDASADAETDADTRLRVDWCLEGATPHTLSDTSPPEAWQALTRLAASHPVTLLLAADAVSHFHLAAPRGLKRREWPLLLETVTSEAVDQLHLNPLQRGRGHLELIALPRAELAAWHAWARRLGLAPTGWSCAFLALPRPARPDQITTLDDGSHRLCLGLAAPVAPGAPEARQWLAWPRDWPLPPAWRERECQVVDGDGDGERHDDERHDGGEAAAEQARRRSLTWLAAQPPPRCRSPMTAARAGKGSPGGLSDVRAGWRGPSPCWYCSTPRCGWPRAGAKTPRRASVRRRRWPRASSAHRRPTPRRRWPAAPMPSTPWPGAIGNSARPWQRPRHS